MECWRGSLRYHYCRVHDLLCVFPAFLPIVFGGNRISFPVRQLSQGDTTFKATRAILKKIIRLSIETGSLTGTQILFQSSIYAAEYANPSCHWDRELLTSDVTNHYLLPNPHGYHWKGLRQFDARLNQQSDAAWL
jgi:hypothetical protein